MLPMNTMVTDPVCNMQLDERKAMHTLAIEGDAYYFCSEACRAEFERHKEDYVRKVQPERERETDVQISLLPG
jgi:YHS domain-containing protein